MELTKSNDKEQSSEGIKKSLSKEQYLIASEKPEARQLVLAGPGAGKTEVVAHRLVNLLRQGLYPAEMLVLSFSRNAVRTLIKRIGRLSGECTTSELEELRHLTIRTFDSWSFRILRMLNHSPADLLNGSHEATIRLLIEECKKRPQDVLEILGRHKHIIVDEFQDLSGARGALVIQLFSLISSPSTEKCGFTVLGDGAQAIYGFTLDRASDPDYAEFTPKQLLGLLRSRYGNALIERRLEENHRAQPDLAVIVQAARDALEKEGSGQSKFLLLTETIADLPDFDHKNYEKTGSTGILCRTNGDALTLAHQMQGDQDGPPAFLVRLASTSAGNPIPFWIGAILGKFKGASLSFERFDLIYKFLYPDEEERKAANAPEALKAWALLTQSTIPDKTISLDMRLLQQRVLWRDFLPDDEGAEPSCVEVITIHQSKGMEYDRVAVITPSTERPVEELDYDEEANVLFVAISRAASSLTKGSIENSSTLTIRTFANDSRRRWYSWKYRRVHLEIGIKGDVDPVSFVSKKAWSTATDVEANQAWLARNSGALIGHKVVLVKTPLPNKPNHFFYAIHLQENSRPGRLLGEMSQQLVYDLLSILHTPSYRYPLPKHIHNLRIHSINTATGTLADLVDVHSPWSESGLWISVNIHGIGGFNVEPTAKRRNKK